MRKKRLILGILIMLSILYMFYRCGYQEYYCDPETVESVQIVSLKGVDDEYQWEYDVLCNIPMEDSSIIDKINNLKQRSSFVIFGDPSYLSAGHVVIKINYFNGDYDMLYRDLQCKNRSGTNHSGYVIFDAEQFSELVRSCLVKYSDFGVVTH